jgi:hypothetical protein
MSTITDYKPVAADYRWELKAFKVKTDALDWLITKRLQTLSQSYPDAPGAIKPVEGTTFEWIASIDVETRIKRIEKIEAYILELAEAENIENLGKE